ncbi:APC family permease [Clostridium chromiireducens]|uniref:Low-affinity putrescine importer PlaP n=1 Tax=Clostridium chromiireducens TaxID=225345 RepID=A0A1V4IW80_9CLOT|nr:APC family permease [Clostridium chromiireducens]OPJ64291.1 Low-affinity putrescine importer PlaP [Clostridium chromiireducens]
MEHGKLKRTLKTSDLVIFGLVFMIPLAPAGMYGVYLGPSGGMVALCYLIGMVAMFFTGMSYRVMAQKFPTAGSVYVYVQKGVSPALGFLTGWAILLDYFLMPATVVIIGSIYGNALIPSVPAWIWILIFIVFSTVINVLGVDLMSKCSWILFTLQIIVIIAFIGCTIRLLLNGTIHFNMISFYNPDQFDLSSILKATGIVILSYLGYDAISTLAEETINPEKSVGKAIILSILIIGLIFIATTFFAGMAYPNYQDLNPDTAFTDVVTFVGGTWLNILTTITLIVSFGIATTQASQVAVARVLFAMGRDGVLPKQLAYVSKKTQSPVVATVLVGIIITPISLFCSLNFITSIVSFGALLGFILLNIAVISRFLLKNDEPISLQKKIINYGICPVIGLAVTVWIFINLDANAHLIGAIWLLAGCLYLAGVTKFFRNPVPQLELS